MSTRSDAMINATTVKLPVQEWDRILQLGVTSHIKELESELSRAVEQIRRFEGKYRTTFARLREAGLPESAGLEEHEDFVEWSSWEGYAAEVEAKLANLHALVEA
jgi:hypothetical protein